ncbi:MAG TPA: BatD family protein, partial [Polyangia bacterium]|nr:BatD family protein [Polyangia bacterium]
MRRRPSLPLLAALAVVAAAAAARPARAASLSAELDREAVAPGEPFVYQVTLTTNGEDAAGFRPPDFHGFQVQQASGPNRSTSMQFGFGGGQQTIQSSVTWTYQLVLPAGAKGPLTIGAAHVRVGGRDLASNAVQVRVGAASAPPRGRPGPAGIDPNRLFQRMFPGQGFPFGGEPEASGRGASTSAGVFIRAVADKTRVFVGQQVTVAWYLYATDVPSRYSQVSEPHTDGFWSEDVPSTTPPGRVAFTEPPQTIGGRTYNVALLFRKALFPLAPGKLTVTPMEAEVGQQADFFSPMEVRRLKTEPLVIEAEPLPAKGEPPGFESANVGQYEVSAAVDRAAVAVGDAVTLKVAVKGTGNVRNVRPPALPPLAGWKTYEPKTEVALDGAAAITGTKTVEWLMRPERPGKTTVPPLAMETFDPAARRYQTVRSQPIEIVVTGEPSSNAAPGLAGPAAPAGVENVVAGSIRPIHARAGLGRESGVAFLHSAGFTATVVTPPLALAAFMLFGRVRERLGRDTGRTRRRRLRTMAARRLRAAEAHRAAGRTADFYVEIDRVLREALSERLGSELGGLRLDELGALLAARGFPAEETARVIAALEACDEARFAPGGAAADPAALGAMLARAGELVDAVERAPLGEG